MGDSASAGRIGNHVFFFLLLLLAVDADAAVVSSASIVDCKADDDVLDGAVVMAAELNDWKDAADGNNKSSCNIIGIIIITCGRRAILFIAVV